MHFPTLITLLPHLLTLTLSSPLQPSHSPSRGPPSQCLHPHDAALLVTRYIAILSHTPSDLGDANTTAQLLLDDAYTEISDSVLSLKNLPLNTTTFPSKQAYIAGVLNGPAATDLDTLDVLVAGCTKVLWYWNFHGVGDKQYEVKGFNLFTVTAEMKILTTALEFNSLAWGLDTGLTVTRAGA